MEMKVEKSHIDALVASLEFKFSRVEDTTVTGCWAYLPNGFKVGYGESACVDPNNFNEADGQKYAKERCIVDATNKLWELEGYLLKMTGAASEPSKPRESDRQGFKLYDSKPVVREAYQLRPDDFIKYDEISLEQGMPQQGRAQICIDDSIYEFAFHEQVKAGDFIVFLNDNDIYHYNQKVFAERNII